MMDPDSNTDAFKSSSASRGGQPAFKASQSFGSEDIVAVKKAEESVWLQQEQRRLRWLQRLKEKVSDREEQE